MLVCKHSYALILNVTHAACPLFLGKFSVLVCTAPKTKITPLIKGLVLFSFTARVPPPTYEVEEDDVACFILTAKISYKFGIDNTTVVSSLYCTMYMSCNVTCQSVSYMYMYTYSCMNYQ